MADFRIRIDEEHEHRADLLDQMKDVFGEPVRTNAVLKACEHARQDARAKEEAVKWIAQNLPPEEAEQLAEILSTSTLQIAIQTETHVGSLDSD